jgi:hypothetical protein
MKIKKEESKKETFIVQKIEVLEIPDQDKETKYSTIMKINFDGILINLTIPAAMRLQRKLSELLEM